MARSNRRRRGGCRGDIDVIVSYVEEVVSPNLEKALAGRGVRRILGRHGDVSLILKSRSKGRTEAVMHIVITKLAEIAHIGIKGVRGWDPGSPSRVSFPVEWRVEISKPKRGRKG